ncbi:MAG: hypothetical protein QXQ24_07400 [Nitrososphaeria archaeon]
MSEITLDTIYREVKDLKVLIDSLAETIEILANLKELKGIRRGLMDLRKSKTRSWNDFEQELKKEGKL